MIWYLWYQDIKLNLYENLAKLFNHCKSIYRKEYMKINRDKDTIKIYMDEDNYWSLLNRIPKRSLKSIYLPQKKNLNYYRFLKILRTIPNINLNSNTDDINDITVKEKYKYLCIPYKLNVLLEGPPGTGKTSTIKLIASQLKYNIRIINFTPKLTDDIFTTLVKNISDKSILVLEDFDDIFEGRKVNDENKNMISLKSILAVLDGLASKEGLICIISTNFIQNYQNL